MESKSTIEQLGEPQSRPWMARYPRDLQFCGRPQHSHILALYKEIAFRSAEAIRYFDSTITFNDLDILSDAFAVWLQEQGVSVGDRVGIILQNVPHFVVATIATWKIGAIPVPGNPMYKADELSRIFADYLPSAIVCHDDHFATVEAALLKASLPKAKVASVNARDFQSEDDKRILPEVAQNTAEDFLALCKERYGRLPDNAPLNPSDIGLILYTSGTTGVPKGAVISHASIAFNAQISLAWMLIGRQSRILALAPYFHITGFILHMAVGLASGCSVAMHYRFQPDVVADMIRSYRPTVTIAAITAFNALMNTTDITADNFSSFKQVFTGGAPIAPALRDAVKDRFGVELCPVYGMTESCSPTHIAPPGFDIPVHPSTGALSVGLPISFTDARIVDSDGREVPPGTAGEIWMRGPQIMTGYWNKPEETEKALLDGWLRSGDVGIMDQNGWFYVVDRQKDMINASGFKVWPSEVEDVLLEHPAVREAAVVGVPDDYRGETVHAFVSVKKGSAGVETADLVAHCRARLAAYKVPRNVRILDELPKTPTGKIQRAVLRDQREHNSGS